ncbi:unnamed protein product [Leptosia nina]|uniref:Uncharacterized protein n=1 Tax=Leptosia nina TaxID=320188 RepID=A0AAV1J7B7_9NEOP
MKAVVILVVITIVVIEGRTIRSGEGVERKNNDFANIPMEILLKMKPNRFVPINNVLFFKISEPCEDGLKRDAIGICREVWE